MDLLKELKGFNMTLKLLQVDSSLHKVHYIRLVYSFNIAIRKHLTLA